MNWFKHNLSGLMLCVLISVFSIYLSHLSFLQQQGISALTIAIIIGMLLGNTVYSMFANYCNEGVNFAKGRILRLGIILYGFRLSLQQLFAVGLNSLWIDLLVVSLTFLLGVWTGNKLKINSQTSMLVASGASICGAAAVLATAPVVKAKSDNVSVAVATVVIFGTVGMFVYPWLFELLHYYFPVNHKNFGIYIGSTVHEVAQVVVAGHNVSLEASNNAVITKMLRVMLLAPFLLILSWGLSRYQNNNNAVKSTIVIPWFALGFVIMVGFNSLLLLPEKWVKYLIDFDSFLLCMAMSALGLTTQISAIKQAGSKPLLLALILFLWLMLGGGLINYLFTGF